MADKNYNEAGFFQKLNIFARIAGHTLVEKALQLYYAAESKDTPKWAKGVVMGALAYFVSPIDAIPDVIPGIGFTDDFGVLIGAVATIAAHITPKQKAVSITHKAPGQWKVPGAFSMGETAMHDDPKNYTSQGFWDKVNAIAKAAGQEVVEKALQLYYTASNSQTPVWAKTLIYGALAYLIAPLDMIPDFIPVAGFTDDLGIMAGTFATVIAYITPEIKKRASEKLDDWFK